MLDDKVQRRIAGKSWDELRHHFQVVNDAILSVAPNARGDLTTIYVKYTAPQSGRQPYAVVWLKKSSELVVGYALPDTYHSIGLTKPPLGYTYAGLTRFVKITASSEPPVELTQWAADAYSHLCSLHST